jgi:hypothetical protein
LGRPRGEACFDGSGILSEQSDVEHGKRLKDES